MLRHAVPRCAVQVLTNAGQANAATGDQGYEDAVNCATLAAASLGVSPDDVLLMSTGAQWGSRVQQAQQTQMQKTQEEGHMHPLDLHLRARWVCARSSKAAGKPALHTGTAPVKALVLIFVTRRCDWKAHEDGDICASHPRACQVPGGQQGGRTQSSRGNHHNRPCQQRGSPAGTCWTAWLLFFAAASRASCASRRKPLFKRLQQLQGNC